MTSSYAKTCIYLLILGNSMSGVSIPTCCGLYDPQKERHSSQYPHNLLVSIQSHSQASRLPGLTIIAT